jgi:pimeloyl-ACP methyl ester carboxylesterase
MFLEGFELERVVLPQATLRIRRGGLGPPVLLLHGHPRAHTTWYKVVSVNPRRLPTQPTISDLQSAPKRKTA